MFATGGYMPGSSVTVTVVRAGDCVCGFPLFRIDGGSPEHILNDDMVWRLRLRMLACATDFAGGA